LPRLFDGAFFEPFMLAGVGFTVLGPVEVESYFNGLPDRRSLRVAMAFPSC